MPKNLTSTQLKLVAQSDKSHFASHPSPGILACTCPKRISVSLDPANMKGNKTARM